MPDIPAPHIFRGYGLELEYMIVRQDTLDVLPVTDEVLRSIAGSYVNEVDRGPYSWSNELVLHVIEVKNNAPLPSIAGLAEGFQEEIGFVSGILATMGACLMPTAMHPWMNPQTETKLWPHSNSRIYESYNRIFNCKGHGWSNLQSTHVNLAFQGDEEFARLHAAIRLVLPVLPALAASSPFAGGRPSGLYDTRLEFYRANQESIPSIIGSIIPERVFRKDDYARVINQKIYDDISPHDPDGILQHEWLNSRGAIGRFERSAIEIRLLDIQESPAADLAVASGIIAALKALDAGKWSPLDQQKKMSETALHPIFLQAVKQGEHAVITDAEYLSLFGFPGKKARAGEIWMHLYENTEEFWEKSLLPLRGTFLEILELGTLAGRLIKAAGQDMSRPHLEHIYRELCRCLAHGELFTA